MTATGDASVEPLRHEQAADRAAEFVERGMVVGFGSGAGALLAMHRVGELLRTGALARVFGVPTSAATEAEARRLRIPLLQDDLPRQVDLTIAGADEVEPGLDFLSGDGTALLRERIVLQASRRVVLVADESAQSPLLGARRPVAVEVASFGWRSQVSYLESIVPGAKVSRRVGADGLPVTTEQGALVLDWAVGPIRRPRELAIRLAARTGVVAHGLFLSVATDLLLVTEGGIEHRRRA